METRRKELADWLELRWGEETGERLVGTQDRDEKSLQSGKNTIIHVFCFVARQ